MLVLTMGQGEKQQSKVLLTTPEGRVITLEVWRDPKSKMIRLGIEADKEVSIDRLKKNIKAIK